jgi:hypothetical protein
LAVALALALYSFFFSLFNSDLDNFLGSPSPSGLAASAAFSFLAF